MTVDTHARCGFSLSLSACAPNALRQIAHVHTHPHTTAEAPESAAIEGNHVIVQGGITSGARLAALHARCHVALRVRPVSFLYHDPSCPHQRAACLVSSPPCLARTPAALTRVGVRTCRHIRQDRCRPLLRRARAFCTVLVALFSARSAGRRARLRCRHIAASPQRRRRYTRLLQITCRARCHGLCASALSTRSARRSPRA